MTTAAKAMMRKARVMTWELPLDWTDSPKRAVVALAATARSTTVAVRLDST